MPQLENNESLRHYYENWWKVENQPVWYLAGKDHAQDSELAPGWYFNDETEALNGPYETRAVAEAALEQYCKECL